MAKRTNREKKDAKKNLAGALIFLSIFFLAYDYWKNSTKDKELILLYGGQ